MASGTPTQRRDRPRCQRHALFFAVMRFNTYASRVIEVQEGQSVIDSFAYLPLLTLRLTLGIRDEEAMLRRDLPGCEDYCAKRRWRMLPGIW